MIPHERFLNALSAASRDDGVALRFLIRPAYEGWVRASIDAAKRLKTISSKGKGRGLVLEAQRV